MRDHILGLSTTSKCALVSGVMRLLEQLEWLWPAACSGFAWDAAALLWQAEAPACPL